MLFGASIRFSTAVLCSGEYPTSSSYPAHLRNRGKVEQRTTSLTQGVWRKIHIAIDEQTLEIRAAEFTTSDVGDAPMLPELLDQIPPDQEIQRHRRWCL